MGREPKFEEQFSSLIDAFSRMGTESNALKQVDAEGEKFGHHYVKQNSFNNGVQFVFKFANGFGASVIQSDMSYGHAEGKWELAVLKGDELCYTTSITEDVLGWLSEDEVKELLIKIAALGEEE